MSYIDAFIAPVPEATVSEYQEMANMACQVWMDHGALSYVEYLADDVPDGEVTSFPQALKLQQNELACIAVVHYRSREHRDSVMAKVMADERMASLAPETMPFDGQRMFWGGFKPLVSSV